ncbi:LysR family transcriptional regulator [Roseinatronobacter monicus]|uniref:DNA-binding transcriptional LysR family regulator n=1 Tax=Roseinatronobacter monicus TaxID=393481 RepID=A0A543KH71_9RHOB|nr:LysR family transcriptional regulator [Roseinatronobacter monicus]TQM94419.1 DNA-binding transcriptional LysR family regulator [Roseinatronobacter monicus]
MLSIARLKSSHLRLLLSIADTGKLQLAADQLAISQPAASRILAEIEADIGAAIFERLPRGMMPTAIGQTFLRRASVILSEFETLENELQMIRSGKSGKVRIGAVTGPAVGYVVPAVRHLRQFAPDIEVTIHVAPSAELARGLEERNFDFIISRLPTGYDATDLEITPARTERVALLVNENHPLAAERGGALEKLRQFEWVMQDRGTPIRQAVENAFFLAGQSLPDQVSNSSSLLVALTMLSAGDVITPQAKEVADLLTETGIGARLAVLDIAENIMVEPYFVIRHRHHSATEAVMRLYQRVLDSL